MGDTVAIERSRGLRKERNGIVVSKSGDKTVVVLVERRSQHPVYGKTVRQFKKYHAHDEKNEAKMGDHVRIVESRPMSRMKRWRMVGIVSASQEKDQAVTA
jgi:small subunit ribosomal protein S17